MVMRPKNDVKRIKDAIGCEELRFVKPLGDAFTRVVELYEADDSYIVVKKQRELSLRQVIGEIGYRSTRWLYEMSLRVCPISTALRKGDSTIEPDCSCRISPHQRIKNELMVRNGLVGSSVRFTRPYYPKSAHEITQDLYIEEFVPDSQNLYRFSLNRGKDEMAKVLRKYGEAMAEIHNRGFIIGDTRATNVLIKNGECIFTDFEFSHRNVTGKNRIIDMILAINSLTINPKRFIDYLYQFYEGYVSKSIYEIPTKLDFTKALPSVLFYTPFIKLVYAFS